MQNTLHSVTFIACLCVTALADDGQVKPASAVKGIPKRIAFGSCAKQTKPQPILRTIVQREPDLFIYLGDNIYGDTRNMSILKSKYSQLGSKPEFRTLRERVAVLSVWDDHDYGENDAGRDYPKKNESRDIFFDFWRVPSNSPRRKHAGIYGSHRFEEAGKVLQIILLDTRFFRDPLRRNPKSLPPDSQFKNDYQPDPTPEKTLLGAEQWRWLSDRFREPADVRIVCSSIQFGHQYNGWESWTNLPHEQVKMFDLIRQTRANGVIFVSGDVHWGEISVRHTKDLYPLYDVTASGLTEDWHKIEPNKFRIGEAVAENHFGLLEFDWESEAPSVTMNIIDKTGQRRLQTTVLLSELRVKQ